MSSPVPGKLVIISGPSGVGKSTVVADLIARCELPLELSVSATTRAPRAGELDGVNYHFLTNEEFHRRSEAGEFLECKEPYGNGVWYGTLQETVATGLNAGKWVLLEIEVDGAMEAIEHNPDAISIFIQPESKAVLHTRLSGRDTESEEEKQKRLARADYELLHASRYRHQVVNRTVDQAVEEICDLLNSYSTPKQGEAAT